MTISAPGFHHDYPERAYHADPCEAPSLSSSIAKKLIDRSPMHAYADHPRLGGKVGVPTDEMIFGSIVHKLILGKGSDIVVLDADSWRGKDAATFWDTAMAKDQLPALTKTMEKANAVRDAALNQMHAYGLDSFFSDNARSEVAAFWKDGDAWCRSLTDRQLVDDFEARIDKYDIKTMGQSAHPKACQARIASMGYDLQKAHYDSGSDILRPDLAGRSTFTFIFVEVHAPYAVTPIRLDGEWTALGESKRSRAVRIWTECMESGKWPGYASDVVRLEPPAWATWQEVDAGE